MTNKHHPNEKGVFIQATISVNFNIFHQTGLSTWDLKFTWSQSGFTVPADSALEVTTGAEEWSPEVSGRYQFQITSSSLVDIDPTNNDLNVEFFAGNFLRLNLKQIDFKEPYQIDNSAWAYFYIKAPIRDKLWFFNVMGRIPVTSQEAWIVKNMPILPYNGTSSLKYNFDLRDLGYEEGGNVESIDIVVREDTLQLNSAFDAFEWLNFELLQPSQH